MKETGYNYYSLLSRRKIELEYLLTDNESLLPSENAEKLIYLASDVISNIYSEEGSGEISWFSESDQNTIKINADLGRGNIKKTEIAVCNLIVKINNFLHDYNAHLLPSIFNSYDSILSSENDLYGEKTVEADTIHSMKLLLPFNDKYQFYRLLTAVRLILPLLPALTSGSPDLKKSFASILDNSISVFEEKLIFVSKSGFSQVSNHVVKEHENGINYKYDKINNNNYSNDVVSVDHDNNVLALRIFKMQESPIVDFALARFITYVLELLVNCNSGVKEQAAVSSEELSALLDDVLENGMSAVSHNEEYLKLLTIKGQDKMSAWGIWMIFAKKVKDYAGLKFIPVDNILKAGSLSERISKMKVRKTDIEIYNDIALCLEDSTMMLV